MQALFKPQIRVLTVTALLALAVCLYPPWTSEVENGSIDMGEINRLVVTQEPLGFHWLWAAPAPNSPTCTMVEFGCWVDIRWPWLGLELLGLVALGALGWLLDKPKAPRRVA